MVSWCFAWVLMDSYKIIQNLRHSWDFAWILMVSAGIVRILTCSFLFLYNLITSYIFLRLLIYSYDILWILMICYGLLWAGPGPSINPNSVLKTLAALASRRSAAFRLLFEGIDPYKMVWHMVRLNWVKPKEWNSTSLSYPQESWRHLKTLNGTKLAESSENLAKFLKI